MRYATRLGLVLTLVLISGLSPLAAQIRDFVPVVRPVFAKETVAFLEKLSESMKSDGYNDAADILKGYASGGFGSGFAYVAKDGSNYVVTNRHVVSQAETVTLEFEKPDGSQTVYKNCAVLAVGEDLDLALVALPASARPFSAGLEFAAAPPDDGAEVWTAGYPGLGNTPSWQLGKGNVTNGAAKIPALIDPAITTLIQHSAQVDPGNSGGPLLVVDKASKSGYRVAGINTWKAFDRQATNFSIPAAAIGAFIANTLSRDSSAKTQAPALEARCRGFISASSKAEDAYKELAKYVSYAYVARDGEAIIKKVLSIAPTSVRSDIIDVFSNVSPIEGIRLAIAYRIVSTLRSESAPATLGFVAVDGNADAAGADVPVRFTLAGKELSLTWLREHGVWRLASYPMDASKAADSAKAKKGSGVSSVTYDDSPYTFLMELGPDLSLGSSNGTFWKLGMYYIPFVYGGLGTSVAWQSEKYTDSWGSAQTSTRLQVEAAIRAQLPIRTDSLAILPYASLLVGRDAIVNAVDAASGTYTALEGGAQIGLGADPHLFLGAAAKFYLSSPAGMSEGAALSLWLGAGF
jgi:serine protease Do